MKIDTKSAVVGLVAGALVTLAVGAGSDRVAQVGRYQVAGTSNHAVIIDTSTGHAWSAFLMSTQGKTDADFWNVKNVEKK